MTAFEALKITTRYMDFIHSLSKEISDIPRVEIAEKIGISLPGFNNKLLGRRDWKIKEIEKLYVILRPNAAANLATQYQEVLLEMETIVKSSPFLIGRLLKSVGLSKTNWDKRREKPSIWSPEEVVKVLSLITKNPIMD